VILFGSAAPGAANSALSGNVTDETGSPLRGAKITLQKLSGEPFDESSQTDSQGRYSFPELPDGEYSIEAGLKGFGSVLYKPVQIFFPAQVRRNFVLEVVDLGTEGGVYASSELVGELTWKGARVAHANVCAVRTDGQHGPVCTTTNRLGQYFPGVPPGLYTIAVDGQGGLKSKQQLDMSVAGEYRNKITLADGGQ
jgi:hypothetical protein